MRTKQRRNEGVNVKIIALDSSGLVASVAVMTENTLIAEYTVNYKKTHSQTLLPMLDEIVRMSDTDLSEIDAIAISEGPGSFTGLRIGAATAKGLGLALNKNIISVPTLEALAYNLFGTGDKLICPLMDARRNQVYTAVYRLNGELEIIAEQRAVLIDDIISLVNAKECPVVYLGDGVEAYKDRIEELTKVPYSFAPPQLSKQRAGAVGLRAFEYLRQGRTQTAGEHAPVYLRVSQAEREYIERTGKNANPPIAGA